MRAHHGGKQRRGWLASRITPFPSSRSIRHARGPWPLECAIQGARRLAGRRRGDRRKWQRGNFDFRRIRPLVGPTTPANP
ncbi:hypothetical protein AZ16_0110 [Bordetella bronchiseptica B18-5 (C3)]|nr:hypothetical protein AZ16_0110 [Bordetella bronchiseptica B18-5 (C3)]